MSDELGIHKFVDKDLYDISQRDKWEDSILLSLQLSRDIKDLVKAIRSLKTELDPE